MAFIGGPVESKTVRIRTRLIDSWLVVFFVGIGIPEIVIDFRRGLFALHELERHCVLLKV